MMNTYPRAFSHVGISVPDVVKAVEFYSEVMGWYRRDWHGNTGYCLIS